MRISWLFAVAAVGCSGTCGDDKGTAPNPPPPSGFGPRGSRTSPATLDGATATPREDGPSTRKTPPAQVRKALSESAALDQLSRPSDGAASPEELALGVVRAAMDGNVTAIQKLFLSTGDLDEMASAGAKERLREKLVATFRDVAEAPKAVPRIESFSPGTVRTLNEGMKRPVTVMKGATLTLVVDGKRVRDETPLLVKVGERWKFGWK